MLDYSVFQAHPASGKGGLRQREVKYVVRKHTHYKTCPACGMRVNGKEQAVRKGGS